MDEQEAEEEMIHNLCGGPDYGLVDFAIEPKEAKKIWDEFMGFFGKDKIIYQSWLGDPDRKYIFQFGVMVVDKDKAGVLSVLQDD